MIYQDASALLTALVDEIVGDVEGNPAMAAW